MAELTDIIAIGTDHAGFLLKASENALSRPLDQISNANLEEQLRQLEESIRAT